MLFILEGCDGTGKSTLAVRLKNFTAGHKQIIHFSQPRVHPLREYELSLDDYKIAGGKQVICDRFHWGEMIYSEIYRNGSKLGAAGFWHVEQYLASRGAVMIHVTAPIPVVRERLENRGEDYLQPEHLADVVLRFAQIARESMLYPIEVDTSNGINVADIVDLGLARQNAALHLRDFPSYVGPGNPDLLLVGEEPNTQLGRANHAAAFPPYTATSGKYLIENVILPLEERSLVGLVNAYHHGATPIDVKELWRRCGRPNVVALGRRADHHLSTLDVPHDHVPHPQYWRRFRHADGEEYRDMIVQGRLT